MGVHPLDEGPVRARIGGRAQRARRQHHHADHAGHVEAALARLEAWQHVDPADLGTGHLLRQAAIVLGRHRALAVAQQGRDTAFGHGQGLGVLAAGAGQRLMHLDRRQRARAADHACAGELGEAARRQVARPSAAEAAMGEADAHLAFRHAAAHAVAEAQRAGLGVELEGAGLAGDDGVGGDRGELVDAPPFAVTAAGLLDLDAQARCIDRAGRQLEDLVGGAGGHAEHAAADRAALVGLDRIDADPRQLELLDAAAGPRPQAQPADQARGALGVVEPGRVVADAGARVVADVVGRRPDQRLVGHRQAQHAGTGEAGGGVVERAGQGVEGEVVGIDAVGALGDDLPHHRDAGARPDLLEQRGRGDRRHHADR